MSASSPNELAGATLIREVGEEGQEVWKVITWVASGAITPFKAVTALKSGILQATAKVIQGEMPAPGNGEVETLSLIVREPA